jgi:hypothetical protein
LGKPQRQNKPPQTRKRKIKPQEETQSEVQPLDPNLYTNKKATDKAKHASVVRHSPKHRNRRNLVDPTTTDIEYTADQVEFMMAMESYKTQHNCPYPDVRDILKVLKRLGYSKE